MEFYENDSNISILEVVKNAMGINIPQIKSNAWKSVSNAKIDLIDYEKITSLSNIENEKELLNKKSDFLMSFLYSNIYEKDKNVKQTLKMIIMDILQTEKTMLKRIEHFENLK